MYSVSAFSLTKINCFESSFSPFFFFFIIFLCDIAKKGRKIRKMSFDDDEIHRLNSNTELPKKFLRTPKCARCRNHGNKVFDVFRNAFYVQIEPKQKKNMIFSCKHFRNRYQFNSTFFFFIFSVVEGVISCLKGHKKLCRWRDCACQNCRLVSALDLLFTSIKIM